MKASKKFVPLIYALALATNIGFFYFVYNQITGVKAFSDDWQLSNEDNVTIATRLAEIERNLGYVGFIHHFKNYIIRRTDEYLERANKSYYETRDAINNFKALPLTDEEILTITDIERTINQYHDKLKTAATAPESIDAMQLDRIVKVDDLPAADSLAVLRTSVLARMSAQKQASYKKASELSNSSIVTGAALVPLFFISTLVTLYFIRRLSDAESEKTAIFDTTPDAILYIDEDGQILSANKAATSVFGYTEPEFRKMKVEELLPENLRDKHIGLRKGFMAVEHYTSMSDRGIDLFAVHKQGHKINVHIGLSAKVIDKKMRCVCIIKDLTEYNAIIELSQRDHLTAVFNRRAFDDILEKELSRANRSGDPLTLLLIDIDNFKWVNDTLGHDVGDKTLVAVANFLSEKKRHYDSLSRWGGDEFAILCPGLSVEDAQKFANRLCQCILKTGLVAQTKISFSIGVATSTKDSEKNPRELCLEADKSLYAAKENGKNQAVLADSIR